MDKVKFKNVLNALKGFCFKDYFDEQDGKDLLVALQDLIASLEQSEELVTAEQLSEAISAFFAEKLKKDEPLPEQLENSIRQAVRNAMGGGKPVKPGYLDTAAARRDLFNVIRNSRDGKAFREQWQGKLVENGISGLVYPTEVSKAIETSWRNENGLFGRMTKVASEGFKLMYAAETDLNNSTHAHGHTKGAEKTQQAITAQAKELALQMVYKWIPVDRFDLASMKDDDAFLQWIVSELTARLMYSVERHIISGPLTTTSGLAITSLESIGAKTAADFWTTVVTTANGAPTVEELYSAVWQTEGAAKWLYIDRRLLPSVLRVDYGDTKPTSMFITLEQLGQQWGVERVIPYDFAWTGDTAQTGYASATPGSGDTLAVCLSPADYYRIGGEPFGEQWTIYDHNQEAFMAEVAIGGGVGKWHASSVVKAG